MPTFPMGRLEVPAQKREHSEGQLIRINAVQLNSDYSTAEIIAPGAR